MKSKSDLCRDDPTRMSKNEKDDWYKNIMSNVREILNDNICTKLYMQELEQKLDGACPVVHMIQ